MLNITQYIINQGIPEDIFILIFSIPIIFLVILFARRMIGFRTFGLFTPLILVILLSILGIKHGIIIFITIFVSMMIIRYFLRKITLLSMTDTRMLDASVFCILILVILLLFFYVPFFKQIPFNTLTLLTILMMSSYIESLLTTWEARGFKRFIAPVLESLSLIVVSYFLINWSFIQDIILKNPLGVILISVIIIFLLARWRGLKIREFIEFKEVIKHVELPEKK